jgi:uncharacterized protein (TIGR03437 family)
MLPLVKYFLFSTVFAVVYAQSLVPSPSQLTFAAPVNGLDQPAVLTVTSTGAPLVINVSVNTFGVGHWLSVSPTISGTPATLIVTVNSTGLAPGLYLAELLLSAPGATSSPISVPVRFNVGGVSGGALTVVPASLTFTGQTSGFPPLPATLAISSSQGGTGFATSATTYSGGNWLHVRPLAGTAPAAVEVAVATAGLPAGTYTGNVLITPSTGGAINIPVTLQVASGNLLGVSASSLQFYYQIGSLLPSSQTFNLSNLGGTPINFSTTPSTNDGRNWLTVTPPSGMTPQTITVGVNAPGLNTGVYTGRINISAPAAFNSNVEMPVTLTVSNGPLLTAGAFPSRFTYQVGSAAPAAQSVFIGSTSGALNYSATVTTTGGGQWLAVSPASGQTPRSLSISVNPESLAPGTYSGSVNVSAAGAANSPITIPVSLTVADTSTLTASVESIRMNYQVGGTNQVVAQVVGVYSTGTPVDVTAAVSTSSCGGNWLRVYTTSFTTPAAVTVAIDPIGFVLPAECSGVVTFTPVGSSTSLQIPVTMRVATTPLFNHTPMALNFSAPFDGSPTPDQEVALSMTDASTVSFAATPSTLTGGGWLRLIPGLGTTPATLRVSANPVNLSVGTYTGSIVLASPALGGAVQSIPVTFRVTSTVAATANPASLTFTQTAGAAAPPPQSIALGTTGGPAQFAATTSTSNAVGWLSVGPNTGSTPNTIFVAVNAANLPPGNYSGAVTLTMPAVLNSPVVVPVTLNVLPARIITAPATALSFTYRADNPTPTPQTVRVTSTGAGAANLSAAVTGGSWLRVTPSSAASPANFDVSVDAAGLATGEYTGTITISSPGLQGITIPVTLTVLTAPAPALSDLYNAASGMHGALAPGEIVTIRGVTLGPAQGVEFQITPDGKLPVLLGETRVWFDDIAAPLLYVSAGQINMIAPYEIAGRGTVRVVIEHRGVRSPAFTYQVAATSPGIFTASSTGRGQGSILNQDNSVNSAANPAEKGSIVQVFGTGEGVSMPLLETGGITPPDLRRPAATVTALVGGLPAQVVFAGPAPNAVSGLFQANVEIPRDVTSGNLPIVLVIGGVATQTGVTVAVR